MITQIIRRTQISRTILSLSIKELPLKGAQGMSRKIVFVGRVLEPWHARMLYVGNQEQDDLETGRYLAATT